MRNDREELREGVWRPIRRIGVLAMLTALTVALAACGGRSQSAEAAPAAEGGAEAAAAAGVSDIEARLAEMGVELPEMPPPTANFVRAVRTGNLVFLAGHGPLKPEGGYVTGKLGRDHTVEEGQAAARLTAIALLASLKAEIGDLDRVKRIVKVKGMVNSMPDFTEQHLVMNGCSDFLVELFGERGKHARAAVGMASLPVGLAVEIEMVVEVE